MHAALSLSLIPDTSGTGLDQFIFKRGLSYRNHFAATSDDFKSNRNSGNMGGGTGHDIERHCYKVLSQSTNHEPLAINPGSGNT